MHAGYTLPHCVAFLCPGWRAGEPSGRSEVRDDLTIRRGEVGRLVVAFAYSKELVAKIRVAPGRRWDPKAKHWTVPDTVDMPDRLLALFAGVEVLLDPELQKPGSPPTNQSDVLGPLLWRLREAIRARHLSPRTEEAYTGWVRRFARQAGKPIEDLGPKKIAGFLSSLALRGRVAASTQNQALNALMFLYQQVLGKKMDPVEGVAV